MKMIARSPRLILIAAVVLMVLAVSAYLICKPHLGISATVPQPDYWPTQGWQTSTPEEQGIDSAKLAQGLRQINQSGIPIHSLMIVRNGKVLLDATFYPYDGRSPHSVGSVTKSLTTTLIGIAVDQGRLHLADKMVSFFPDFTIANLDARKSEITIGDLATMSSGLDCLYEPYEPTVQAMEASPDWIRFGLDLPMAYEPGTHWEYCGVGMHLLSGILERAVGMSPLEFARQNLFGQIVSRSWVEESVKEQVARPGGDDYGYGWWSSVGDAGMSFFAEGNGGQVINVNPGFNTVVVTTGGGFAYDDVVPYIIAAFLDPENPLPANPAGAAELQQVLAELLQPPSPRPVHPLPDIAAAISGKAFRLDENPFGIENVTLTFVDSTNATFQVTFTDGIQSPLAAVGLDGVYRPTPGMNLDRAFHRFVDFQDLSVAARGQWLDQETFLLEYDTIVNYYFYRLQLRFVGSRVSISAGEREGAARATFEGRMQTP
jgi:CubicO group peptidase (beta-lactamase class C family)